MGRTGKPPRRAAKARHAAPAWPPVVVLVFAGGGALPPWLQKNVVGQFGRNGRLAAERSQHGGTKPVASRASAPAKPLAKGARRKWADFPKSSRAIAERRRRVMVSYFAELALNGSPSAATREGVRRSAIECRTPKSEKTIQRWARRVTEAGGIQHAPPEVYLDSKSCAHPRARKSAKAKAKK